MSEEPEKRLHCPYTCGYRRKRDVDPVIYNPRLKLPHRCEVNPDCVYPHQLNLMSQLIASGELLIKRFDPEKLISEIELLSSLPDHLKRTYKVIRKAERISAEELSEITGLSRAVESGKANQLIQITKSRADIRVVKERDGRKVNFYVEE